jgi:transposase
MSNKYSIEFKERAVKLITEEGYSKAEAARSLGIKADVLDLWENEYLQQKVKPGLSADEIRDLLTELNRLREENKRLRLQRLEILKGFADFLKIEANLDVDSLNRI